jgi:hypothetical protein
MPKKPKVVSDDMWINPKSNLIQNTFQTWDRRSTDIPTSWPLISGLPTSRYLELADVALRPPEQKKRLPLHLKYQRRTEVKE